MALHEFDYEKEPTVAIVKKILMDSIKMKATDIHFDPREDHLSIKFRLNGDLQEYTTAPENVKVNIITRIKILAGLNITESSIPQVGTINFEAENQSQNMRVSTLPILDGEKVVVHLSNYATNIKNIDKLGFQKENLRKLKDLLKQESGIILITGTTGSGKSTTLYSILKELSNKASNIISIEEPVKMKLKDINQVEINPDKGVTLKSILPNILLQDPNIVCISELYDDETTRSAVRTAITGRLVISTMQTKNAYQTIDTLLNMDVENYLLGSYLNGIISQRIVKKLCPSCRDKRPTTKYEKAIIKRILNKDVDEIYFADGCEDCRNGYIRQIPVTEVVMINDELRSAISNNKDRNYIRKLIYEENESIIKNALNKVIAGETSFEEFMRIMDIKIDFTKDDEDLIQIILGNVSDEDLNNVEMKEPVNEETKPIENKEVKEETKIEETNPVEENEEVVEEEVVEEANESEEPSEEVVVEESEENQESEESEKAEETKDEEQNSFIKIEVEETDNNEEQENEEAEEKEETEEQEITITTDDENNETEEVVEEVNDSEGNTDEEEETDAEDDEDDEDDYSDDDDEDDFNYGNSYSIKK